MKTQYLRVLIMTGVTKLSDLLVSPQTTLPWLFAIVGAPAWVIPVILPIKESGSMIPQWHVKPLLASGVCSPGALWRLGSLVQGVAIGLLPATVLFSSGTLLGVLVIILLAVAAIGRSLCSLTFKLIQADLVEQGARGRLVGMASSVSGGITVAMSLILMTFDLSNSSSLLLWVIGGGAALFLAGYVIALPVKVSTNPQKDTNVGLSISEAWRVSELRQLVLSRLLSAHAALIIPFLISVSATEGQTSVFIFMLLAAIASFLSSYLWGLMSDKSAVSTLRVALGVCLVSLVLHEVLSDTGNAWISYGCFLTFSLGYAGVRMARKTYVLDISTKENRSQYVAASNTLVGWFLLAAGLIYAALVSVLGSKPVVWLMLAMLIAAFGHSYFLKHEKT